YFELALDPTKVQELDSAILITEEVLRHLLVVHEENTPRADAKGDKAEKKSEVTPEAKDAEEEGDK
ncbi:MAG TPA: hypothetical protein VHQ86_00375, partial [Candidatus Saccharimonadia bacterium]|nr:hypothetical protein [Candidatus Saccharimonadia bacterium]